MNQQTDPAQWLVPLFFVLLTISFLVAGLISYRLKHKRLEGLSDLAKAKGWRYNKSADVSLTTKVPGFPFVDDGGDLEYESLYLGESIAPADSDKWVLFDYFVEEGKYKLKILYAILMVNTGLTGERIDVSSSPFSMLVDDKEVKFNRKNAIGFEDYPDFNKGYMVHCKDADFARKVLTPSTITKIRANRASHIVYHNGYIMAVYSGYWKSETLEPVLLSILELEKQIPPNLFNKST